METAPLAVVKKKNPASRLCLVAGILSGLAVGIQLAFYLAIQQNVYVGDARIILLLCSPILGQLAGAIAISAGIIALLQIRKTGEPGKAFSIAGIILGVLGLATVVGFFVVFWIGAWPGSI